MSTGRTSKVRLGLLASLVLGLLTLVVAASPAVAADAGDVGTSFETGGLVFTTTGGSGETTTNIVPVNDDGVVVIQGGDAEFTVTQQEVGTGKVKASAIQLGSDTTDNTAYTGTITLSGVTLDGTGQASKPTGDFATIYFANTDLASGDNAPGGATVVLSNGTVIKGSYYTDTAFPAVQIGNGNAVDTLSIEGGSSVNGMTGNSLSSITNALAINVNGTTVSSDDGPVTIQFANGGGTITGGSNSDAIETETSTTPNLVISVNADATVSGGQALIGKNGGHGINSEGGAITIEGESTLTVTGGNAAANETTPGTYGGGNALEAGNGTIEVAGPGVVNATGGQGANVNSNSATDGSNGGNGVSVASNSSDSTSVSMTDQPSHPMFTVTGGTLNATGGLGGSTNQTATAGTGGYGVNLNGVANQVATLSITGGVVNAIGGNGGTATGSSAVAYGAGGSGIKGADGSGGNALAFNAVVVSQASLDEPAPELTVQGGLGGPLSSGTKVFASAFTQLGTKGSGILINTPVNKNGKQVGNWNWVALANVASASNSAELSSTPTLEGFAGMNSASYAETQDALTQGTTMWAQVTTAPLESISAGVVLVDSAGAITSSAPYVVAQTEDGMVGPMPNSNYIYAPSLAADFTGLENVDTSNFGELLNFVAANAATIEPAANVATATAEPRFYVVPGAKGNTLSVTLNNEKLPASITDIYGKDLTVASGTVPVVYTVTIDNPTTGGNITAGVEDAKPTTNADFSLYTSPTGDGTLVYSALTGANLATDLALPGNTQPLETIVAAATPGTITNPYFIGLFDETAEPYTQVNNTQVTGWNSNAELTAEWATLTLTGVGPTPISVAQGDDVELNATYRVAPQNSDIESYSFENAGIALPWNAVFVNTGQGSAPANGLSVETTGSTVVGANPFIVTIHGTVTAAATADLGHYRVWPTTANAFNDNDVTTGSYAVVNVIAGSGVPVEGEVNVIRLYNPNSGEHLYTTDPNEAETLENTYGWDNENVAWVAPTSSGTPIYRLYNPYNGDHLYTTSINEYDTLTGPGGGWRGEGVKLYSAGQDGAKIYRLYNPNMTANGGAYAHLWTGDFNEYVTLGIEGWDQESVAFYAVSVPNPS